MRDLKIEFDELGKYCSIVNGSTPKTGNSEFWKGDIVWITPTDLGKNKSKYISNSERKITEKGYNSSNTTIVKENNIILSTRAPIGHIAINSVPACTNQGCKTIIPNEKIDSDFLYYFLRFNKEKLMDLGSGSTFKELSTASLSSFKIPAIPIDEQKRIVKIIEEKFATVNKILKSINEQIENLDAYSASIISQAFQGKL